MSHLNTEQPQHRRSAAAPRGHNQLQVRSLTESEQYDSFRANVPLKTIALAQEEPDKVWKVYDSGPRTPGAPLPLVCLPPVAGSADVYFLQNLGLTARGYRVISVESPPYWNVSDWCQGFKELLNHLELERVHLFGAALGGFLAQKFAEATASCPRVASLVLCNTFTDTRIFESAEKAPLYWLMPAPLLKGKISPGLATSSLDPSIVLASDFMAQRMESLDQSTLASRLQLNCAPARVEIGALGDMPVTLLDVLDATALKEEVREEVARCHPNAKLAHLKTGGNFPFLSRSDEVNMHLMIHLRNYDQDSRE